ncbi:flagellar assembly peptidoglycan hydrolase FlgJ [Rheinheimera gaetbuli]
MSPTSNQMSYHDLTSLQQIRSHAGKDEKAALRQAAEQFESIFFSMLLSSMRKANAAFEVDGMMNSQTTKFYRDMHDSQMSTELAKSGALGLADILVQQLSPALSGRPAADKGDKASADTTHTDLMMPLYRQPAIKAAFIPTDGSPIKPAQTQTDNLSAQASWQVSSPVDFVKKLLPAAQQSAKVLGLDPLALVAQAALETGWGQRMIKTASGSNSFNLFGIKANNGWQGETAVVSTLEYRQGVAQKEQAKFRSYGSLDHSLSDYVAFIRGNPRYEDAVAATHDTKRYFEQLQAAGYATDPAYAKKIMAVYQSPTMQQVRSELEQAQENAHNAD